MAKIIFGPIVESAKGSIGGVTFQSNAAGTIIRSRPHVSRKSTHKQNIKHLVIAKINWRWQQLTEAEREQWNTFAATYTKTNKFGQVKKLTGLNWFFSVNFWRIQINLAHLTTPPIYGSPMAPPDFSLILSNSAIKINFLEAHNFDLYPVAVWGMLPTKRSSFSLNQTRKLIEVIEVPPSDPYDITTNWSDKIEIAWNPSVSFPSANIFICLESFTRSTGITSTMLCTKNTAPAQQNDDMYYYSPQNK